MIAKRQDVDNWLVLQYFAKGKDNHIIKLEMEIKEDE
jgi:hypothetical protein